MRLLDLTCSPDSLSPAALAFVGDGVFELLTREWLACQANRPAKELNQRKVQMVSAPAQAAGFCKIEGKLTPKEYEIFKRGRNAHVGHVPKNATHAQYHCATGVETLFGWLYLSGQTERTAMLFQMLFSDEMLDIPSSFC